MLLDIEIDNDGSMRFAGEVPLPVASMTLAIDEYDPVLQDEAYRILGPSMRAVFGDAEGAKRESNFYVMVLTYGSEEACEIITEAERDYFSDSRHDDLTPEQRRRHRYYYAMLRAAALHLDSPGVEDAGAMDDFTEVAA
jgi:hypothetical protein